MSAYTKHVSYSFECGGEFWEVTDFSDRYIQVEEVRKNGSEDTHTYLDIECIDGVWIISDSGREHLRMYKGESVIDLLESFFAEKGPPDVE